MTAIVSPELPLRSEKQRGYSNVAKSLICESGSPWFICHLSLESITWP